MDVLFSGSGDGKVCSWKWESECAGELVDRRVDLVVKGSEDMLQRQ